MYYVRRARGSRVAFAFISYFDNAKMKNDLLSSVYPACSLYLLLFRALAVARSCFYAQGNRVKKVKAVYTQLVFTF